MGPPSVSQMPACCPQGIRKPYNPILGETFRCCWFHPQTSSHTFYIAEQARAGSGRGPGRGRGSGSGRGSESGRGRPTQPKAGFLVIPPLHPPKCSGLTAACRPPPGRCRRHRSCDSRKFLWGGGQHIPFSWGRPGVIRHSGLASLDAWDESWGCPRACSRGWRNAVGRGGGAASCQDRSGSHLSAHRCPTTHPCPPSTSATGRTASALVAASQPSPGSTVRGCPGPPGPRGNGGVLGSQIGWSPRLPWWPCACPSPPLLAKDHQSW